jgi:hypothetical protein
MTSSHADQHTNTQKQFQWVERSADQHEGSPFYFTTPSNKLPRSIATAKLCMASASAHVEHKF